MPTRWIPSEWELPEAIAGRLGEAVGRQRALLGDGHLLLILHAPPRPDQGERVGRAFWRRPDGTLESSWDKGWPALDEHLAEYAARFNELEKRAEAARDAEAYFEVLEQGTPLSRATRNLHCALQQARELVSEERRLLNLLDGAYNLERSAELLMADTRNACDLYLARQTEMMARQGHQLAVSGHRLNLLAALFLPMATMASVFGMNLETGYERALAPWLFLAALAIGSLLGLLLYRWLNGSDRSHHPDRVSRIEA